MTVIEMPVLGQRSSLAWHALFDLAEKVPNNWCLVGGQMVHLWCIERGTTPNRPTDDADAVLDVRAEPTILHQVTKALVDISFESVGETPEGHQCRWIRGDASSLQGGTHNHTRRPQRLKTQESRGKPVTPHIWTSPHDAHSQGVLAFLQPFARDNSFRAMAKRSWEMGTDLPGDRRVMRLGTGSILHGSRRSARRGTRPQSPCGDR